MTSKLKKKNSKQTGKCQDCGKEMIFKTGLDYGTCEECVKEYLNKINRSEDRTRFCEDAI